MDNDRIDNLFLSYLKWWDEKNKDKDRNIEYDFDFEHEVVEHISHGDILQTMEITDD